MIVAQNRAVNMKQKILRKLPMDSERRSAFYKEATVNEAEIVNDVKVYIVPRLLTA